MIFHPWPSASYPSQSRAIRVSPLRTRPTRHRALLRISAQLAEHVELPAVLRVCRAFALVAQNTRWPGCRSYKFDASPPEDAGRGIVMQTLPTTDLILFLHTVHQALVEIESTLLGH